MTQSSGIINIAKVLIPLIDAKNTQRQISKTLNKPQAWVSRKMRILLKMNLIEKRGNTRSSFYVVNHAIFNSLIQSLRGAEDGPGENGRIHNVIIKYRMLKKPQGLDEKKINLTNWRKYQAKYGGITVEWSDDVKDPFFLIRYPIVHAVNFVEAERNILEKSRNIAEDISENHGLVVEAMPSVKYGEIAFKGDPVANAVCNFGNYDNGTVKVDQSEGEPEHEFHGSGDEIFRKADDYFSLPARVGKVEAVLTEFKGDISEDVDVLKNRTEELAEIAGLTKAGSMLRHPILSSIFSRINDQVGIQSVVQTRVVEEVKGLREGQATTDERLGKVVDILEGVGGNMQDFGINLREHRGAIQEISVAAKEFGKSAEAQAKTAEVVTKTVDVLAQGLDVLTQERIEKTRGGNGNGCGVDVDAEIKKIFGDVKA